MHLLSIASAFPECSYTQAECWDILLRSPGPSLLAPESMQLFDKVLHGNSGIAKRHFALEDIPGVFGAGAEELNHAFEKHAPALAAAALGKALEGAGIDAAALDALFVCTCTGYLCPGVSSHVAEQCALRGNAVLQDIVGLGCGAALPTLRTASDFLSANPGATVAVIAVEVCSAAFYLADDPGVIISLCLFGDGASASIWTREPVRPGSWRAGDFHSLHLPEQREKLRFVNAGGKLRNKLHRTVPAVAARAVEQLYTAHNGSRPYTIAHPGGRDVIQAIERRIPDLTLSESREVLRDYGNLSSPSVLVALESHLRRDSAEDELFLTSFGAGFSCHSCRMARK